MPFITVAGQNLIAAKQGANQVLDITQFVFANIPGLGAEPVDRVASLPPSGQIVATRSVTRHGYVNPNQVVYSIVLDSTVGDWDFNWIGLKSAEGTLIAVAHIPLTQKRANAGATPGNNLTRNFLIAYNGIAATAAATIPAETWQIDFTTRLLEIDERERLDLLDLWGHDAFVSALYAEVPVESFQIYQVVGPGAPTDYFLNPGTAYVGGIRAVNPVSATVGTPVSMPCAVWLDVWMEGDLSSRVAHWAVSFRTTAWADYVDGGGVPHYVVKLADIAADGSITDRRKSRTAGLAGRHNVGLGSSNQVWTNVNSSRTLEVYYTNTSDKPRAVSVGGKSLNAVGFYSIYVESPTGTFPCVQTNVEIGQSFNLFTIVPPGHRYALSKGGADTLSGRYWYELRDSVVAVNP